MNTNHLQKHRTSVRGVSIYETRQIEDLSRGNLTVAEFGKELPFVPLRYFITFEIPTLATRGEHAHKECEQFLICVRGRCSVIVDDGQHRQEYVLHRPTQGIYVPPMVWAVEHKHSFDSALMVFASHRYDPDDYIRDYGEFLAATAALHPSNAGSNPARSRPRPVQPQGIMM